MHIQTVNLSRFTQANVGSIKYGYFGWQLVEGLVVDPDNYIRWNRCREVFHSAVDMNKSKEKYWYVTQRPEPVVKLVEIVENIIGLEPTKFSIHWDFTPPANVTTIYGSWYNEHLPLSNIDPLRVNLLQVEPSKFWLQQPIRHSFFTCVLRAGLDWDMRKNALQVLKDCKYFNNKRSIDHFLNGRTWYTGPNVPGTTVTGGWHRTFNGATDEQVDEKLITPPHHVVEGRAYYVWEEWGKPQGREAAIWNQAEKDMGLTRE